MTFDEIRTELKEIAQIDGLSPAEDRILDVLNEMTIALQTQSVMIQEMALNQVGVNVSIGDGS